MLDMKTTTNAAETIDRDTLIERLKDAADEELYREVSGLLELTERGAELVEAAGMTVAVDSYGCAYCVEQTTE